MSDASQHKTTPRSDYGTRLIREAAATLIGLAAHTRLPADLSDRVRLLAIDLLTEADRAR